MTLDKHQIDGIGKITSKTLPTHKFEEIMQLAGYRRISSQPAEGDRIKVDWYHYKWAKVEAIYTPDQKVAITAYHPEKKGIAGY